MKKGLVLEGGAMRGIFTAGVIDVLMENHITFDGAIGVSAGACFGVNIKSKQIGRAFRYNMKYAKDPRYASVQSWIKTGDFFNAEFCYRTLPEKLDPMDAVTYSQNPMKFYLVATDIESGEPYYYDAKDINDESLDFVRASASMPVFANPVHINGHVYLDGGISDSIPIKKFQEMGYEKNVVVLTQPKGYRKQPNKLMPLMHLQLHRHPKMLKALAERHIMYNKEIDLVLQEERKGNVFVLQPQIKLTIGHTSHNPKKMQETYEHGRKVATEELEKLKQFLAK